jgi:hypothetical protein
MGEDAGVRSDHIGSRLQAEEEGRACRILEHGGVGMSRKSSGYLSRRDTKSNGPPEGEAWAWMTLGMMESAAFRALSHHARKVLDLIGGFCVSKGLFLQSKLRERRGANQPPRIRPA